MIIFVIVVNVIVNVVVVNVHVNVNVIENQKINMNKIIIILIKIFIVNKLIILRILRQISKN